MNKQITVLGLAPMQFIILLLSIAVIFFFSRIGAALCLIPVIYFGRKLAKETKNGNPDFFSSMQNALLSIDTIEDNKHVMRYIISNNNEHQ